MAAVYRAAQITLTLAATNYSLLTLLRAVDSGCPSTCRELQIQGTNGNSDVVKVGDANLALNNYGFELAYLESRTWRGKDDTDINIGLRYVRSETAGQKLNVDMEM